MSCARQATMKFEYSAGVACVSSARPLKMSWPARVMCPGQQTDRWAEWARTTQAQDSTRTRSVVSRRPPSPRPALSRRQALPRPNHRLHRLPFPSVRRPERQADSRTRRHPRRRTPLHSPTARRSPPPRRRSRTWCHATPHPRAAPHQTQTLYPQTAGTPGTPTARRAPGWRGRPAVRHRRGSFRACPASSAADPAVRARVR